MTNEGDASVVGFDEEAWRTALKAMCNERFDAAEFSLRLWTIVKRSPGRFGSLCRDLLTRGEWPVSRGGIERR
eukprot:9500330-Karenia_brevis.AAC.1